jgi:nitroreductase
MSPRPLGQTGWMSAPPAHPRSPDHPVAPLFTERWSPRAFTDEAIDAATLATFFEAARWAPSASNEQPWRFVYGLRGTPAFALLHDGLVPANQAWAQHAAALVLVASRTVRTAADGSLKPLGTHAFDTGAAWVQFALQATLSGWHAHAMGGFDGAKLRAALAVPEVYALHAVVAVGRRSDDLTRLPAAQRERETPSGRRPLSAFVAEGRFDFDAPAG